MQFKASTPSTAIFLGIWNEVRNHELGLCIELDPGTFANVIETRLYSARPPECANHKIKIATATKIYIIAPGVNLDDYLS